MLRIAAQQTAMPNTASALLVANAVMEMSWCFTDARDDPRVGVVILTGAQQPCVGWTVRRAWFMEQQGWLQNLTCTAWRHLLNAGEGPLAFCSGGDQSVRGKGGYVGEDSVPRLNVLDLQMQIRRLPKPVVAMVAGYAVGGGHILHMVCDLTVSAGSTVQQQGAAHRCAARQARCSGHQASLAALHTGCIQQFSSLTHASSIGPAVVRARHHVHALPRCLPGLQIAADNAVFGQTGPKVGSFDAGYGSTHMARLVGQKKAREIWFLARLYDAQEAAQMGLVNKVRCIVYVCVWCGRGF